MGDTSDLCMYHWQQAKAAISKKNDDAAVHDEDEESPGAIQARATPGLELKVAVSEQVIGRCLGRDTVVCRLMPSVVHRVVRRHYGA